MKIICPCCNKSYELSDSYYGKFFTCEKCGMQYYISYILNDNVFTEPEEKSNKKIITYSIISGIILVSILLVLYFIFK